MDALAVTPELDPDADRESFLLLHLVTLAAEDDEGRFWSMLL
jgi:hypothetical protein